MLWDESKIFKLLPFYNSYIERPKIKKLNNVQLLKELLFYDELSIIKNNTAFSGFLRDYKVEVIDKRDVIIQLESSKISIKNLFKESLVQLKGFEYKITLYVLLSKVKGSDFIEYSPVFNSLTKTVISNKYFLDQCFNDIIFKLENWIWHGSGWIVEKIVSQYLNISSYLPLSGSSYCELPKKLSNSMKGLINIQITDQKCFFVVSYRTFKC